MTDFSYVRDGNRYGLPSPRWRRLDEKPLAEMVAEVRRMYGLNHECANDIADIYEALVDMDRTLGHAAEGIRFGDSVKAAKAINRTRDRWALMMRRVHDAWAKACLTELNGNNEERPK